MCIRDSGRIRAFDDDMDAYRRLLLSERSGGGAAPRREEKPRARALPRNEVAPLKAEVAKCEARVAKLEEMREAIDGRLSNPLLYARGDADAIEALHKKRAEVEDGLARAEALWMAALERLESATDSAGAA